MSTVTVNQYKSTQVVNPFSLLAQLSSHQTDGCLKLSNDSVVWSIYLEQGKLIYASNSVEPFDRLDSHLRRLSREIPTLVSQVRVQVRLLFESQLKNNPSQIADYQAISWLVEQQYLNFTQAAALIEALAEEVMESLLEVKKGTYYLVNQDQLEEFTKFCRLDLRTIVEHCYVNLRHKKPIQSKSETATTPDNTSVATTKSQPQQQAQLNTGDTKPNKVTNMEGYHKKNPPTKAYKIVCIDDSPTVLNSINLFLDDQGFSVVMISDPVKALMQIVRIKPDLILLDVGMPELDGYELCSLLRKHRLFKTTPIIMVTGHTGFIDRAKAKLVRASGYLTKPFNQSELLKIVFKHLS
ncbi:MAG: response regulator [Symploca sp. SIO2G7]|nr:response regulator [Symploca sp. SIO2G7]